MDSLQILVGAGKLYMAPLATAFPLVDAAPAVAWVFLGETDGGVTVTKKQTVDVHRVDQFTGPIKATRSEEDVVIETSLAVMTLENMADVIGNAVADTAPGAGTAGYRKLGLTSGFDVDEHAFLFRADSPYLAGKYAQYELPIGVFNQDEVGMEYVKDGKTLMPISILALVNPSAATEDEQFGRLVAQDALPTG